jgi:hypothetical protein
MFWTYLHLECLKICRPNSDLMKVTWKFLDGGVGDTDFWIFFVIRNLNKL